jgi:hypothetical protein
MLGHEKFIEMFPRFNFLLDNFKGKRSGDLGKLNIHEIGTERNLSLGLQAERRPAASSLHV